MAQVKPANLSVLAGDGMPGFLGQRLERVESEHGPADLKAGELIAVRARLPSERFIEALQRRQVAYPEGHNV